MNTGEYSGDILLFNKFYLKKKLTENKYIMLLIILFFLLPQNNLLSAENNKVSVLTCMILPEDESLITLGDVITDSIMLELKIAGYDTPYTSGKRKSLELNKMLDSSKESGSRFFILNSYELNNDQIKFKIDCYEADKKELLISIEKEEQIGFFLDSAINESMTEVISKIEENLPETTPEPEKTLLEPDIITEKPPPDDDIIRQYLISASVSPFMTTGKAARYFTHGWEFYLYGGYPFTTKLFDFTAGVFMLVNRFNSEGVLIGAENTFLTFGPEIRVMYEINSRLSFYTNASAGGTVFVMKSDVDVSKSTMLPHLSAGAGLLNIYTPQLSGFFHMRFSLYFEESVLITGFSPGLGINYRI